MYKFLKVLKRIVVILLITILIFIVGITGVNIYVVQSTKDNVLTVSEAAELDDVDCIIVLGASVVDGNRPSAMLAERLDKGVELYFAGCSDKILMSGDHCGEYYNEVSVMKEYAVNAGVHSSDIILDHYGISTYDTMYRAKEVYGAKKVVIVTQKYHLSRSMYIAESMGMEVYGVPTEDVKHSGQFKRDVREVFARVKDVGKCLVKSKSKYSGESVSLDIDGDLTNER